MAEETLSVVETFELEMYPPGSPGKILEAIELGGQSEDIIVLLRITGGSENGVHAVIKGGNIPGRDYTNCRELMSEYFRLAADLMEDSGLDLPDEEVTRVD